MSNICRVDGCSKERDIKKRSSLCSMHRSRWSRHKSFDLITEEIPEGFAMKCLNHGFLTDDQIKSTEYKSKYTSKTLVARTCRECIKESQAKSLKNFPEKVKLKSKKSNIKRKYGLSWQEYESLKLEQNNLCKICNNPETALDGKTKLIRELCVDHCHETGAVRGLLCTRCNHGIGKLRDSIDILESAIEYLRPHKEGANAV